MSIGKRNNSVGTTFTAPTNSLMPLSPEERQRLGLQMTQTLGNTNLMDFGQFNSGQQVPIGVAGVPEKIPATNIPKVSKFGNLLARMGGMDSKDIIGVNDINNTKMTQEQMDNYSQQRNTARGKGMSDLLLALGTAFKGEDIIKTVGDARDKRTLAEETARITDLNTQMAEAYRQGDFEKVRALALEMNDPSMNQAIFNNMNKDMSTVSADGKLILERDQQGNIIGASPNQEVIDALAKNSNKLGASVLEKVVADETEITTRDQILEDADMWERMIENDEIQFGFLDRVGEGSAEFFGVGTNQEGINSRNFENWRAKLKADILNLQPGVKTDFDYTAVERQLEMVNSKEGALAWIKSFKENQRKDREKAKERNKKRLENQGAEIEIGFE